MERYSSLDAESVHAALLQYMRTLHYNLDE